MADQSTPILSQKGTNVGIGTGNPTAKLHVVGANNTAQGLIVTGADPNQGNVAKFVRGNSEKNFYIGATNNAIVNLATEGSIYLKTNVTADQPYTTGTTTMALTSAGLVGIGTTTPATKLEVRSGSAGVEAARFSDSNYADLAIGFPTAGVASIDFEYGTAGALAFRSGTGKNERMRITSDGNVGINTTSPSVKFHVVGSSILSNNTSINADSYSNAVIAGGVTQNGGGWGLASAIGGNAGTGHSWGIGSNGGNLYMGYENGSAAGTMQTYIQFDPNRNLYLVPTSGNVGIGTTAPSYKLQVEGGGVNIASDFDLVFQQPNSFSHGIVWKNTAYTKDSASIRPTGQNAWAVQGIGFFTGNAGNSTTAPSLRMDIQPAGNIYIAESLGIGNTGPSFKLDITDAGAVISGTATLGSNMKGLRLYNSTSATTNNAIGIWFNTGPHQAGIASFRASAESTWETTLAFYTHVNALSALNDATEKMRITGEGNVGIGTSSPSYKLDVSGTGRFTSDLYGGGDIYTAAALRFNGSGLNATDKKLYSPTDGELQWMTHTAAGAHAFSISHQGTRYIYLDINGSSYFNGGKVGIGLTSPQAILDVSHTAGTTNIIRVSNGSGNYRWRVDQNFSMIMTNASNVDTFSVTTAGVVTAASFFESSDIRLKSNIRDLDIDVSDIAAKMYEKDGVTEIGYIAQEVEDIISSAISKREDGYLDLSYRQVHTAKIAMLEKRIAQLESQLKNK
jgi:hypothetical protein